MYNILQLYRAFVLNPLNASAKVPYLGWWPSRHDANLTPLWCPVESQLPRFPQATGPHPFPSPLPFQPHRPTHVTQFQLWKMPSVPRKPSPPGTIDEKEKRNG
jgi:hypothetical protein